MMSVRCRWGICGTGKISYDFVAALETSAEKGHEVVAVGARSQESASKFAELHGVKRSYGCYKDVADDDEVDIVYVGTIHPTHFDCVKLMLEKGKSVLCEKPLTMNIQDTVSLIKLAKSSGQLLIEGMWTRHFPAVAAMRRRIADGCIGEIKFLQASFGFKREVSSQPSRLDDPKLGGGAVLDVGVYPIGLATMLFHGRPSKISATGWLTSTGVDEFVAITLEYADKSVAQLTCSIGVDLVCEAIVYGTKGKLKLPSPFWCPTKLETAEGVLNFPLPKVEKTLNFVNSEGLAYEAEHVRSCLQARMKESDIVPLEHSLVVAEIVEDVMKQLGVVYFRDN